MVSDKCKHKWKMTNVKYGFLVNEKCYHCGMLRTYFTSEDVPPKEEHKEGEHYWNYAGSAQSIKFDMECTDCGDVVSFEKLMGLMQCMYCDDRCYFNTISKICESQNIWVYGAISFDVGQDADLTPEKLVVLTDYFTSRLRTPGKKIIVLPGSLRKNEETCHGLILRDVGMLSLEPEEAA
jgi:hypothetical protein